MVKDLMVTNGWILEGIPGLVEPHFETLTGLSIGGESVETVDGVTNKKKKFSDQIVDYSDITLTRPFQSDVNDYALQIFAIACIKQGYKIDIVATKRHKQIDVFSMLLKDFRMSAIQFPDFNVEGREKFVVTYPATIDDAYMVPLQFDVTNQPNLVTPVLNSVIG